MDFDKILQQAKETYQALLAALPKGTYFEETKSEGGKSLYVSADAQTIRFHTVYAHWYSFGFRGGVFYIEANVRARREDDNGPTVSLSTLPDHYEKFLAFLAWAVAMAPGINQKLSERRKLAERLIVEIESVFPPLGLDGGVSLSQAVLDDDYLSDDAEKMAAAYSQDVTENWRDIPDAILESHFKCFSVFTYLDQKGWRYYLPAVLRNILRNPSSPCEFYTRISLLPGASSSHNNPWSVTQFVDFLKITPDEGRIITKVLLYMKDGDPDWFREHPVESEQLEQFVDAWMPK